MGLEVAIDGVDVSDFALEGSSTRRLNRLSQATVKFPMDAVVGSTGSRLKISFDGELHHHGRIMTREFDGGEDFGYVVYNSEDPMELWKWRPCRDYDSLTPGNMIEPTFLKDKQSGPQIIQSLMLASENPAFIPEAAEGPLFLEPGDFEEGGADLSGAPTNYPISMQEMASLLTSTGRLDIVLTPIDSGGNMARIDCYNGRYGTDRRGEVIFEYGMGAYNVKGLQWTEDLSNVANKIQYFFTPRETTTRYKANITGDNPCLYYGGGDLGVGGSIRDCKYDPVTNPLGALRRQSRADYGVRFEAQEFDIGELIREDHSPCTDDPNDDPCDCVCVTRDAKRELWRWLWQVESTIRARPREMYHVSPVRGFGINAFDIGDLITVQAGAQICGGFSLVGRVYEYTVSWTPDGPFELSEIVTSPSQEGF